MDEYDWYPEDYYEMGHDLDTVLDYCLYENKPPETFREKLWCRLYLLREKVVGLYRKVRPYRIQM